jgi:hypothetical protein
MTSVETYLRGELQTYSSVTINLYYMYTLNCKLNGHNLVEQNLANMVAQYGYVSLAEVSEKH